MKSFVFIAIIIFALNSFAQEQSILQSIKSSYEAFNYIDVIRKSEEAISNKSYLSDKEIIEIYLLKGIAHYSISEELNAQKCFIEILKLYSEYSPDPALVSPKIISLFNATKEEFLKTHNKNSSETRVSSDETDSLFTIKVQALQINNNTYKRAVTKSLILPGWGHFELDQDAKGWILSSLYLTSLTAVIYFIFNTNAKEKEYLNEADETLMRDKYNSYNNSYKIRNLSIIFLSSVWVYAQADVLFFQKVDFGGEINSRLQLTPPTDISFGININF